MMYILNKNTEITTDTPAGKTEAINTNKVANKDRYLTVARWTSTSTGNNINSITMEMNK